MGIWYTTRERIYSSLEVTETARARELVDRQIASASRRVEGLLRRRFYPETKALSFDWPNSSGAPPWEIQVEGDNEIIAVHSVTSGGVVVPVNNLLLRRWDEKPEPPYQRVQIDLSTSSVYTGGDTWQEAIVFNVDTGYNPTDLSYVDGLLAAGINASVKSFTINPSTDAELNVGVGSLIVVGTERMQVTNRRMADVGTNTAGVLGDNQSDRLLAVQDGTKFVVGELIQIDAERMRIDEITGNNLSVTRAWDGSSLDEHLSGVDIYAQRLFTVQRGILGTSGASHSLADTVTCHRFAEGVADLTEAETLVGIEQSASAYARVVGSGLSARESVGKGLEDLRNQCIMRYGRSFRSGAV
jgi:hypothetical protein